MVVISWWWWVPFVMPTTVEEDCGGCSLVEEGLQCREWVSDSYERGGVELAVRNHDS